MDTKKYKGVISNFWQLLNEHRIEIPIIQRDYAQGRKDKAEIRTNFLNALSQSLKGSKAIKLDFIYGSQSDGASQPLDGQQRLTTLYLLHWYAAVRSGQLNEQNINILKRFSYETRISSREFCCALVSHKVNIEGAEKLSSEIIDSPWFFLSWKKDPTIDAMLRTIDDIHRHFFKIDELWFKLTSEHCLIKFYYIRLEDIGLTDDLYIKMNARGKLLSSFENFKASFIQLINDNGWDSDKPFEDTFASKIDSKWNDLFWQHSPDYSVDEAFIRFIAAIAMFRVAVRKIEDRLAVIKSLHEKADSVKPDLFDRSDFEYLCKCLDAHCRADSNSLPLEINVPLFQHKPDTSLFASIGFEGGKSASYTQKVLFFAQSEYLMNVSHFSLESYNNWMRVVRNIVCRGDVDKFGKKQAITRSQSAFDGMINLIRELSFGCDDIYGYLSQETVKSLYAREQVEEERLKARIIVSDPSHKDSIFTTEDTNLFQGKIAFAFYCIDFDSEIRSFDSEALSRVKRIIVKYFNKDADISNDLRRALLTIPNEQGRYCYYEYWWSFWNVISANKRSLLDSNLGALEFYIYGKYSEDYKIYIKKLIFQLNMLSLKEVAQHFSPPLDMPNWKVRLIKEPELLDSQCNSNHIAIPDDNQRCYLLKSIRPRDIEGCVEVE